MYIIGINCYAHDAAAALIKDGEIRATIEEERLNREKHSSKFPTLAIRKLLEMEGISIDDVDHFAFYLKPWREITGNLGHVLRYFPESLNLLRAQGGGSSLSIKDRLKLYWDLGKRIDREFGTKRPAKVRYVEHHLAHAASAFFVSPFEEAAIITWDGRGESATTVVCAGKGNQVRKLWEVAVPHSLGHFYTSITDYLGFKAFVDEWKVMGMSAYGKDTLVADFRELIRLEQDGKFTLNLDYFQFHTHGGSRWLSDRFLTKFGPKRDTKAPLEQHHYDIAYALQRVIEDAGVHIANHVYHQTKLPALCMTGGVALNVLMNQKIIEKTAFEKFFIQPIASDSGTSLGSALYTYHQLGKGERTQVFESAYLGPGFSNEEIERVLKAKGASYVRSENIERDVAKHIFEGKITGWFQGRMEAGPRALGNRSIVVNPMDPGMKDRLNARVKRRESFRPFAPSVLEERVHEFFEMPKGQLSPYMIVSGNVKPDKRAVLPAITHADNTARVHTVSRKLNLRYWKLIDEFGKLSGVPVLLNTSFNENEPIVCTPEDAVNCFLRTEFDVLGIGDFLVTK